MLSINNITYCIKLFFALFIILIFTGCSQTDMKEFQNNTPKLDLFSFFEGDTIACLLYTSPSPRDVEESRMPSSA